MASLWRRPHLRAWAGLLFRSQQACYRHGRAFAIALFLSPIFPSYRVREITPLRGPTRHDARARARRDFTRPLIARRRAYRPDATPLRHYTGLITKMTRDGIFISDHSAHGEIISHVAETRRLPSSRLTQCRARKLAQHSKAIRDAIGARSGSPF